MADVQKVDLLVQYAIAAAGREEFPRDLGPIHVLKYIYLADLAYAEKHGETYTGSDWQFYHFGPWCPAVHDRIRPAAQCDSIDIYDRESEYGEFQRFRARDRSLLDRLDPKLPLVVSRAIRKAVREYSNDTPSLLEAVYRTKPMRLAAPNERLVFPGPPARDTPTPVSLPKETTARQSKKQAHKLNELKAELRKRLDVKKREAGDVPHIQPRYDDTFIEGTKWLNQQLPGPLPEIGLDLTFDDSVWKTDFRRDDDIP